VAVPPSPPDAPPSPAMSGRGRRLESNSRELSVYRPARNSGYAQLYLRGITAQLNNQRRFPVVYNLYLYYLYATLGNLLGDGSNARNATARLLAIIFMLAGNILFAVVFGNIIIAMGNVVRSRDAYAQRMRAINEALEHQNVPTPFRRRVRRFYEFKWLADRSEKITQEYLTELPSALRVDIVTNSYAALLGSVPFFQELDYDGISMIAQRLESQIYMPDEIILKEGMLGRSMFFIESGRVRVVRGLGTDHETTPGELGDGSFFGETAVSGSIGARRECSVISVTVLQLQRLTRESLEEVALLYPQVGFYIRKVALERRRGLGEEVRALASVVQPACQTQQLRLWTESARHSLVGDSRQGKMSLSKMLKMVRAPMAVAARVGAPATEAARVGPEEPPASTPAELQPTAHELSSGRGPNGGDEVVRLVPDVPASPDVAPSPMVLRTVCEDVCEDLCQPLHTRSGRGGGARLGGGGAIDVPKGRSLRASPSGASDDAVSSPEWLRALREMVRAVGESHGLALRVEVGKSQAGPQEEQ